MELLCVPTIPQTSSVRGMTTLGGLPFAVLAKGGLLFSCYAEGSAARYRAWRPPLHIPAPEACATRPWKALRCDLLRMSPGIRRRTYGKRKQFAWNQPDRNGHNRQHSHNSDVDRGFAAAAVAGAFLNFEKVAATTLGVRLHAPYLGTHHVVDFCQLLFVLNARPSCLKSVRRRARKIGK
jgi:hypothetical protein